MLVTAGEIGKGLGVSRYTVLKWAREGRVPAVRVNRRVVRFEAGEVERALRGEAREAVKDERR
jgi:excisionase family DNA binding protein